MKRAVRLAVSLALSALLLWLAFRNVEFSAAFALLRRVSLPLVGLHLLMLVVIQVARAARWEVLVRPFAHISSSAAFRISNVGNMLILVLPLRLGEFARPYLLKKESGAPLSAGLGAVTVERAIDGLLVTLLFFASTMVTGDDQRIPRALQIAAVLALGVFVGATGVIIAALLWREAVLGATERFVKPVSPALAKRLVGMLDAFVSGLRSLPDAKALVSMILWTMVYWLANGFGYYFCMVAFGWNLPVTAAFTLVSIIVIAIMIPAGPGFLGTFQGGILAGLAIYGIDATGAAAFGLLVYPLGMLVTVGFGLPYLFTPRARLTEIVHAAPDPP